MGLKSRWGSRADGAQEQMGLKRLKSRWGLRADGLKSRWCLRADGA